MLALRIAFKQIAKGYVVVTCGHRVENASTSNDAFAQSLTS